MASLSRLLEIVVAEDFCVQKSERRCDRVAVGVGRPKFPDHWPVTCDFAIE